MSQNDPLDTTLLHTFRAVVDEGSLSGAAARLNCVQSNVTARIKRLEERLGGRLLERGRGGAKVTPFGSVAYGRISDVLDSVAVLEKDLLEAAGGESGAFRLGAMETTAAARLPRLLSQLRRHCPKTEISLKTAPTAPLLALVWKHELDAAFVAGPIDEDRFHSVCAFNEELVALWRADPGDGEIPLGSLPQTGFPLLAFPDGCSYRASAKAWLKSAGRSDTSVTEMGSLDAMIGCAAAGMGVSVVPRTAANRSGEVSGLHEFTLPKEFGEVETHLIWRYDRDPGLALGRLVALLSKNL